jgi:hypothetical protein
VLPLRDQPFPSAVVGDLVAIARAVYRSWPADDPRRPELERIGRELKEALDLGRKSEAGTMGHAGALSRAERLAGELGRLLASELVGPAVEAARAAVRGTR